MSIADVGFGFGTGSDAGASSGGCLDSDAIAWDDVVENALLKRLLDQDLEVDLLERLTYICSIATSCDSK